MDTDFFLLLVMALILLGIGIAGVLTGRIVAKNGFIVRSRSPVAFWVLVVLWIGVGTYGLVVAFQHAARV